MYIIKSYGINHDGVSQNKYMIKLASESRLGY
jgi:hypothetical protein